MTRLALPSLLVAVAFAAASCGGDYNASGGTAAAPSPKAASSLTISNFKFSPATLTARHGAAIEARNDDTTAHTVTADDGHSFDTGPIDPNGSANIKVAKAGRYPYHCSIHAFMKGTLVVK